MDPDPKTLENLRFSMDPDTETLENLRFFIDPDSKRAALPVGRRAAAPSPKNSKKTSEACRSDF